jgi:hypothetical protein
MRPSAVCKKRLLRQMYRHHLRKMLSFSMETALFRAQWIFSKRTFRTRPADKSKPAMCSELLRNANDTPPA